MVFIYCLNPCTRNIYLIFEEKYDMLKKGSRKLGKQLVKSAVCCHDLTACEVIGGIVTY